MNFRLLLPVSLTVFALALALSAPVGPSKKSNRTPTYARDVAPILYKNCSVCHHAGEVTPFNLTSYGEARAKAPTIAMAVSSKFMPPWQALSHGEFTNERKLTQDQIDTLVAWSKAGAPKGDMKSAPAAPKFTPGWAMGQPDFVGQPDRAYPLEASGEDEYRCFVIHTDYPEGKYVTGIELRPRNRKVVHHVLIYVDDKGIARQKVSKDGKPGYASFGGPGFQPSGALGGWAPGIQPQILPEGTGFWLPKGADIVLQMHYHKDGKPETDLTRLGLKFAKSPVDKSVRWGSVHNVLLRIPPGDANYEVRSSTKLDRAVTLLDVIPHMHWLGHDLKVTATLPSGRKQELINVQPYDFNWQTRYSYGQPVHLPKDTVLDLVAHYDNTSKNPRNPNNPPKTVTFGEQTTNEMCFAFFSYTFDEEHITKGQSVTGDRDLGDDHITLEGVFDFYDANHDGFLDVKELTAYLAFLADVIDSGTLQHPDSTAKMAIALYGKESKGFISKAEFSKMARANRKK